MTGWIVIGIAAAAFVVAVAAFFQSRRPKVSSEAESSPAPSLARVRRLQDEYRQAPTAELKARIHAAKLAFKKAGTE